MLDEAILQFQEGVKWQLWIDCFPEELKFRNMDMIQEKEKLRDYHYNLAMRIFVQITRPEQIELKQAA